MALLTRLFPEWRGMFTRDGLRDPQVQMGWPLLIVGVGNAMLGLVALARGYLL